MKKDAVYYGSQRGKFGESFNDNEFFTIPEALEAVNTHIVPKLPTDVKNQKLIEVSRENYGRGLKDPDYQAQSFSQEIECDVGHSPDYETRSKSAGRKCFNNQKGKTSD